MSRLPQVWNQVKVRGTASAAGARHAAAVEAPHLPLLGSGVACFLKRINLEVTRLLARASVLRVVVCCGMCACCLSLAQDVHGGLPHTHKAQLAENEVRTCNPSMDRRIGSLIISGLLATSFQDAQHRPSCADIVRDTKALMQREAERQQLEE